MNEPTSNHPPHATRRKRATVAVAVAVLAAVVFAAFAGIVHRHDDSPPGPRQVASADARLQSNPLLPPGVQLVPTARPVIGNLGGLPVTFPPEFVSNVEYDADPGFGETRQGPRPSRTHQSGIRSLSFMVRYPEFAVTTYDERKADRRKYSIYNTPWLDVGATASSYFGDGNFLERSFAERNHDKKFQYEKLVDKQFGLDAYTPYTVDKSLRLKDPETRTYRSDMRDRDLYFHFDKNGRVDAYIRCSNVQHDAASCKHFFYIDKDLRIQISVLYRRGMLEHWSEIQQSISSLVLSFKSS